MFFARKSLFPKAIPCLKDPCDDAQRNYGERGDHAHANSDAYIAMLVKTPAEATDQVYHGIKQRYVIPEGWQHVDGIETAAEEGKRRDNEQRDEL